MPDRLFHCNVPIAPGNQTYLERARVNELLETAIRSPVVEVVAGAGYGKTHAVYSFLRQQHVITAWIQVSERDNIAERFWESFVQAVAFISRGSAEKLAKMDFPDTERKFDRYISIPRNDVFRDKKYIIVYDDFHLLHDKSVLRFLERTITSPFPNITSIVISRNEPKINFFSILSKGLLTRISEADLRFTMEEMTGYFKLFNIQVSQEIISRVYRDTEGWAFAIHLAALALKNDHAGKGYALSAVRANVFKLLESEVVAGISPELRKFLIKLSLIEHLSADLLVELADSEKDRKLLEELEQIGSFVQYDVYTNTWQIHQLFLAYLKGKQQELSEKEKRDICSIAAGWFEKNELKMDAISYYEKAGAYGKLFDVVSCFFPLLLPARMARFLKEIFDRAPETMYRENALAWILYSRILVALEQFDKAEDFLTKLINVLEAEQMTPFHYRVLSGCYLNLGIITMITSLYTRNYDYVRLFEKGCQYCRLSGHTFTGPAAVFNLAPYQCRVTVPDRGEIEKSLAAIAGMARYFSEAVGGCGYGIDDLGWGELAFFRADPFKAEQDFHLALAKARERYQYEIENSALFYLIRIALFRGNPEQIGKYLAQMKNLLEKPDYLNRYIYYDIFTGWFYIQIGQIEKTASWLKNDFEESDLNSITFGFETLVKAKYHIYGKRYHAALAAIENQKSTYGFSGYLFGRITIAVVRAVCCYRLQDKSGAIRVLEEAWEQAAPNGLDMIFIEMGRDMRTLTAAALKDPSCTVPREWLEKIHRSASAYAKKVFAVSKAYQPPKQDRHKDFAVSLSLSARELEVLIGLSQGLTREEIGGMASISVNTIKSIIQNIYSKLGAVNRADAIRIATSLGIL